MRTSVSIIDDIEAFTASHELAIDQPLVKKYLSIIRKVESELDEKWVEEFRRTETDFQRVCFLLKAIRSSNGVKEDAHGVEVLGLNATKEEVSREHGKSDEISTRYVVYNAYAKSINDTDKELFTLTKAIFYAASPQQKALTHALRCLKLQELGIFDGSIEDAKSALELPCPEYLVGPVHLALAKNFVAKGNLPLALEHFNSAKDSFIKNSDAINAERVIKEMALCDQKGKSLKKRKRSWKCIRPKPPTTKVIENKENNDGNKDSKYESHFIASPTGLVRLKNAGPSSGWTLELTQDVSPGDFLIVEKPFTVSLLTHHTSYCYFCLKRCHSLKPCDNCPHVGFCSNECFKSAKRKCDRVEEGNWHSFDCHGLGPYTCLNQSNNWKTGVDSIHAAFCSLSKVPPNCLLDYICSTGQYRGGSGHQAFVGSKKVRDMPLKVYDTFDYSSIAWLSACSDTRKFEELWEQTVIAVFLTYSLHLGGYPMTWFDEAALFFHDPSPSSCPRIIPASWLAACMLFHIQMVGVNAFEFCELFFPMANNPKSFGVCIYPTISLINHSCAPSAAVSWADKGTLLVYSLQSLSAGSEISISYGPSLLLETLQYRQDYFKNGYFFECKCDACSNNWDEQFLQPERLKCPDCSCIFDESNEHCPDCKSKRGKEFLNLLIYEKIPRLGTLLMRNKCTPGELSRTTECVKKAETILQSPSMVLFDLQTFHGLLINMIHGNKVLEPWHKE